MTNVTVEIGPAAPAIEVEIGGSDITPVTVEIPPANVVEVTAGAAFPVGEANEDAVARQQISNHKLDFNNPHAVNSSQLAAGQDLTLIFNNAIL